jgi:GDPmannose 4,6-dehydratase
MKKTALILGANSQDGHYLINHLLKDGYKVVGAVRRSSVDNLTRIRQFVDENLITLAYFDITDAASILRLLVKHKPAHIFNLSAQSFVGVSFDVPVYTAQVDGVGALNVFETVRHFDPTIKIYQASTSELFGGVVENMPLQGFNETSIMTPKSPYAAAKLFALETSRIYRDSYGMFIANGILFNHSSPVRGDEFVEKKIIKAFAERQPVLRLGRRDTKRDLGHSFDYTRAMISILEHHTADDWVVATGSMISPEEIVNICQSNFNYHPEIIWDCPELVRPNEVEILLGDSSKIREELGWKPSLENAVDVISDIIYEIKS